MAKGVPIQPVLAENEKKKCHSTSHIKICSHKYSLTSFSSVQKIQIKQPAVCWAEARAEYIQVDQSDMTTGASADNFSQQAPFWVIANV